MQAILAILLPLLSKLPGQIGDYFQTKQEIEKIKLDTQKEKELANLKLVGEIAKADLERSKEIVKATGAEFKYFTFFMWFGPYMLQVVYPPLGKQVFDNMLGMPEWYAQSCVAIMFTVWGISVSAPVIANIFNGLGEFFREKRIIKAAMSQNVDNVALFELIRSMTPKNQLSQKQVDSINAALAKDE